MASVSWLPCMTNHRSEIRQLIDAALCQKTHPPQARKFAQSRAVDWWDVEKRVGEPFIACATPLRPTARQDRAMGGGNEPECPLWVRSGHFGVSERRHPKSGHGSARP